MAKKRPQKNRKPRVVDTRATPEKPPPAAVPRWLPLALGVALALATIACYWQVQNNDFIQLDDPSYVSENLIVQKGLTREGLRWAFTTHRSSNWHPLTWLSHMADIELFGLDPGRHHLVNLLLHVASSLLLLQIVRVMTGNLWVGAVVAGLFALHPTHVESVAWLAERKDVLSTFFWMLTMWAYLRYVERPAPWRYGVLILMFGLGLLTKPMLVTLPAVLLLLDFWPLGRLRWGQSVPTEVSWSNSTETARGIGDDHSLPERSVAYLLFEKAPLLLMAAASSWVTIWAQRSGGAVASLELFSFSERLGNALNSYVAYIGKTLWPSALAVFYPHPEKLLFWQAAISLLVLLGISALAWKYRAQQPYLAVGWLWYLGTLLPVIGLIQVGDQAMADRYTYISTIGLFLMAASGAAALMRGQRRRMLMASITAAVILTAFGVGTWIQVGYWKDSITLFERSIALTSDNYKLHNNLGVAYFDRGELTQARHHIEEALRILPDYADGRLNLGLLEFRSGNLDQAAVEYRRALELDPGHAQANDNLGNVLSVRGRPDEAISHFEQALRINPDRPATHNNLATALVQSGELQEALPHFEKAIRLDPGYANAHSGLGDLLARLGRVDEALIELEACLELDPDHLQAHFNLGRLQASRGNTEAARRHFEAAVRIEPRQPEPHFFLGLACLYSNDIQGAMSQHKALKEIDPALAEQLLREIQSGS